MKGLRVLLALGGLSLVAGLLGLWFGSAFGEPQSAATDVFSRSALGHRALFELLAKVGIPSEIQRAPIEAASAPRLKGDLLLLAEPSQGDLGPEGLRGLVFRHRRVILVLPKRSGTADPQHPGALAEVQLQGTAVVESLLDDLGIAGEVVRPPISFEASENVFRVSPTLEDPQLIRTRALAPLVAGPSGLLVGELRREGTDLVVLSDPDVLATFGLGQGENALFAVRLFERLWPPDGKVVFDEAIHGYSLKPSLWRELTTFPLLLGLLAALPAALTFVWAGFFRFGKPRGAEVAQAVGRGLLVDNAAELLREGGHAGEALRAYRDLAFDDLRIQLHLPAAANGAALRSTLARLFGASGREVDLPALEAEIERLGQARSPDVRAVLAAANQVSNIHAEVSRAAR